MEPTLQSKPRGRRRKHRKPKGHESESGEPHDPGEAVGTQAESPTQEESPTDDRTESTGSEPEKLQTEDPVKGTWEPCQTPPLELVVSGDESKTPFKFSETAERDDSSPVEQTRESGQENIQQRSKKPHRRKSPSATEAEEEKLKDYTTEKDIFQQVHMEYAKEVRVSTTEEELCTKPVDPVYTPIHLPISCELYTPAYCVQATDKFDRESNAIDYMKDHDQTETKSGEKHGKSPLLKRVNKHNEEVIDKEIKKEEASSKMKDRKSNRKDKIKIENTNGDKDKNTDREINIQSTNEKVKTNEEILDKTDMNTKEKPEGVREHKEGESITKADVSVKAPKFGFKFGKKVKTPKVDVEASVPGVEISGPKLHAPDVNLGMDVGGTGEVGADVSLPKADVSVKAPKFGFKFGKKAKAPKVEAPSLGGSASATGEADLGVSVKGEAPRGGLKLKLPKLSWPKGSLKLGGDAGVSGEVKVPDASVKMSGPELGGTVELPEVPGVDASVSLPGLDAGVSGGVRPDLGGDVSLTGGVEMPSAKVSVPSKKFHFGFGGKAKGSKKLKTPKVSGKAGVDLDVGADVEHPDVDVKAGGEAKGGKWKFGWSPKITLPKVKLGTGDLSADAQVKLPEASVDVSGPSIALPSVHADIEAPRVDVQLPDVSAQGDLGGRVDLGGALPSLSVGGDVKVPDLSVSGQLPSLEIGGDVKVPDLSVSGQLPSLEMGGDVKVPDLSVSGQLPSFEGVVGADLSGTPGSIGVDVSVPKLDVDASLPGVEISGPKLHAPDVNVGMDVGGIGEVGADVSLPKADVSLKAQKLGFNFDNKMKTPDFALEADVPCVDFGSHKLVFSDGTVDSDVNSSVCDINLPKVDLSLESQNVLFSSPKVSGVAENAFVDFHHSIVGASPLKLDGPAPCVAAGLMASENSFVVPCDVYLSGAFPDISEGGLTSTFVPECDLNVTQKPSPVEPVTVHSRKFWSLRFPSLKREKPAKGGADTDVDSGIGFAETAATTRTVSTENISARLGPHREADLSISGPYHDVESQAGPDVGFAVESPARSRVRSTLPRWFRLRKTRTPKAEKKASVVDVNVTPKISAEQLDVDVSVEDKWSTARKRAQKKPRKSAKPIGESELQKEKPKRVKKLKQPFGRKKPKAKQQPEESKPIPRISSAKSKDLYTRQTWHGADDTAEADELSEPPKLPPSPSGINIQPVIQDNLMAFDFRRRGTSDSIKRRPWSTLELPPPGCVFVNDDYLFPDALTPTKIPSFRGSKDAMYNVPYMDDSALPPEEPEWPIGESRRTLLSQLSQKSDSLIRIAAEEESSVISLDDKHGKLNLIKLKSKRLTGPSKKQPKSKKGKPKPDQHKSKETQSRPKGSSRFAAWFSKSPHES